MANADDDALLDAFRNAAVQDLRIQPFCTTCEAKKDRATQSQKSLLLQVRRINRGITYLHADHVSAWSGRTSRPECLSKAIPHGLTDVRSDV